MEKMKLNLHYIDIKDVQFGEKTEVRNNTLYVNKVEAIKELADPALATIDLDLARPGESVRIIPVKDAIEPRVKMDTGKFFPGYFADFEGTGKGDTLVLRGSSVITTGNIVCYQEGIIDMSGPAAEYQPFSKTNNVVVIADPVDGIRPEDHETAVRVVGIKLAQYLAKKCLESKSNVDEIKEFSLPRVEKERKLPRIMYVNLLLAQGLLHDNFLYGGDAKGVQAQILHPNEMLDGAIVSGNCVTASDKNTTYDHTNNPIVKDLYERHGKDLEFCGVITSPITTVLVGKEKGAFQVSTLAKNLDIDGLIVSEEGGGNPEADIMMIAEAAEKKGIKTVLTLHETSGAKGDSMPLANSNILADAVVTQGNKHEFLEIPGMDKIIGNIEALESLAGYGNQPIREDGSIRVRMAVLIDAISNLGSNTRTGITY